MIGTKNDCSERCEGRGDGNDSEVGMKVLSPVKIIGFGSDAGRAKYLESVFL